MKSLKLSSIFVLILALSLLCVPAYAEEVSPTDEIGDFAGQHWSEIIGSLEDSENPIFDFTSSIEGVYEALQFVSSYISVIWKSIPDSFLVVLTLPIMMGAFFFICSHVRIPDTRPEPGEYSTSESWTTTVTSRDGGAEHTVESHTVTSSRRL